MLRRYNEAQDPLSGRVGVKSSGTRTPEMPETWTHSYKKLERCLCRMRAEQPGLYWHVRTRFVDPELVTVLAIVKDGKARLPDHHEHHAGQITVGDKIARLVCRRWSRAVDDAQVRRGLAWLTREYPGQPFLPREFTDLAA